MEPRPMIHNIEDTRVMRYMTAAIDGFLGDPPDTDFQSGYLSALVETFRVFGGSPDDARIQAAERILRRGGCGAPGLCPGNDV